MFSVSIQDSTACRVDWFAPSGEFQDDCPAENLSRYYETLIWLKETAVANLSAVTGCRPKCALTLYTVERRREEAVDWATNWTSSVYLEPLSSARQTSVEFYSYDLGDLIADVGGYLGLLLGWSCLTILKDIPKFWICLSSKLKTNKYLK